MREVLRLQKGFRKDGIAGIVISAAVACVALLASCIAPPPGQRLGVIFTMAAILGPMIALFAWMLLSYYRTSLIVEGGRLTYRGIRHTKTMDLSEVMELQWGPRLVLRSGVNQIAISHFQNFEPEQRLLLIRLLRCSVPVSAQRNWERFCLATAIPLRERLSDRDNRPLRPDEVLTTHRRWDWMFLPMILFWAVVGTTVGWLLRGSYPLSSTYP